MDQANSRHGGDPSEGKAVSAANGGVTSADDGGPATKKQAAADVVYRECLKNHAASIGGHAVDGCCEFMASSADPLKCAACGCHRNFHRREAEGELFPRPYPLCTCTLPLPQPASAAGMHAGGGGQVKPVSPPTHISSPYNSAPQMLLALSAGGGTAEGEVRRLLEPGSSPPGAASAARRRMRTRFTKEQKERMHSFAEKLGWRLQRQDEEAIQRFCEEIGIRRSVLKVWIHNNKSNFARKDRTTNLNS
ncbi:unnamed protein product [Victoria cruziana]